MYHEEIAKKNDDHNKINWQGFPQDKKDYSSKFVLKTL